MSDRRAFGRRDSAIAAKIIGSSRTTVPCTIRNFSETGALLELGGAELPKGNFRLIADEPRIDVTCQVRHVGPAGTGVLFVGGSAAGLVEAFRPALAGNEAVQQRSATAAVPLSNKALRESIFSRQ